MFGHPLLEQVTEPARLVGEEPLGVSRLEVLAEQHDGGSRVPLADRAGGDEPLVGVRRGHADVDNGDIGLLRPTRLSSAAASAASPTTSTPASAEQPGQAGAHEHHVVGDYDAHGITAATIVRPASELVLSAPPRAPMRSATSASSGADNSSPANSESISTSNVPLRRSTATRAE